MLDIKIYLNIFPNYIQLITFKIKSRDTNKYKYKYKRVLVQTHNKMDIQHIISSYGANILKTNNPIIDMFLLSFVMQMSTKIINNFYDFVLYLMNQIQNNMKKQYLKLKNESHEITIPNIKRNSMTNVLTNIYYDYFLMYINRHAFNIKYKNQNNFV